MLFNPSSVWGWYQRRSKWIKWALLIFVVIAVIIAFIFTFASGGGTGAIDPVKVAKDGSEKFFWQRWNQSRKRDDAAAERIKREEDKRDGLKEGRKDDAEKNDDLHSAVDSADSISSVDDVINSRR